MDEEVNSKLIEEKYNIYRRNGFWDVPKAVSSIIVWAELLYKNKYKKLLKIFKKPIANFLILLYTHYCCDIDSEEA